jgi:hypothetical protein
MEIMSKEEIIAQLTLLDTSAYRCIGLSETGKYVKEPIGYRRNLFYIYNKLRKTDLIKLLNTKNGK